MKTPVSDALVIQLHKVIGKVGKIAQQDYVHMKECLKSEIWTEKELLEWANHFSTDPWRVQNKEYRSVAHFLRDPERWVESKEVTKEQAWTL